MYGAAYRDHGGTAAEVQKPRSQHPTTERGASTTLSMLDTRTHTCQDNVVRKSACSAKACLSSIKSMCCAGRRGDHFPGGAAAESSESPILLEVDGAVGCSSVQVLDFYVTECAHDHRDGHPLHQFRKVN